MRKIKLDHSDGKTKNIPALTTLIEKQKNINPMYESLIIVFWYSIFGFLWITLTDSLLNLIVQDHDLLSNIQLAKGWIFVLLTVVFIFLIVRKRIDTIKIFMEKMITTTNDLNNTEDRLVVQKAITEELMEKAPIMVVIWDENGDMKSVNPYTFELLGYSNQEDFYHSWQNVLSPEQNSFALDTIFNQLKIEKRLINYETELLTKTHEKIYVVWNSGTLPRSNSEVVEYVSFGVDVTQQKLTEEKLKNIAFTDVMTGLHNRVALETEINGRILNRKQKFALMYLDIDNFKYVNDSLGHHIGDELLQYIARCLKKIIAPHNYVARLGGDEFAIIIGDYHSKDQVHLLYESIKNEIGKTWFAYNHYFYISLSIGVSIFPDNGEDLNVLSKHADIAMYGAKNEGKDRIVFFEDAIERNNLYHIDMAKRIQKAIDYGEFELYYQPQYSLSDRVIRGFEALIRWNESVHGFISPAEFIPLSEDTGQIFAIERWVFTAALNQKMIWNATGYDQTMLSINLSSKTLISDSNFASIEALLMNFTGDLSKIVIEITETALIGDMGKAIVRLHRLKELGLKIALDDFGTGYSSLTHIKVLPIDIVKLDRSFISQIEDMGKSELIINSVIQLVKKLGYSVIAEGIENQQQYDYLLNNHCEQGQGFLMSRPVDIKAANSLLAAK